MELFISWSGERSHRVAEALSDLVGGVIQQIKPWMSSEMDRGTIWFSGIGAELNVARDGIVCLTRENLTAPWILFEAGALAKNFGSQRVCTFLVDLEPKDVSDPLAQFNHTLPQKDSIFQLVKTLNGRLNENALSEGKLKKEFELHWPSFEEEFKKILSETEGGKKPPRKSERDLMEDVLAAVQRIERVVVTPVMCRPAQELLDMGLAKECPPIKTSHAQRETSALEIYVNSEIERAQKLYNSGKLEEAIHRLKSLETPVMASGNSRALYKILAAISFLEKEKANTDAE